MNWNKKKLSLEDGLSFDILDTVDQYTSAIAFCFSDPAAAGSKEKITELAHCLEAKHVAVLAFETPIVFRHQSGEEGCVSPDPEDVFIMQSIMKALVKMYEKYRSWFLCYAEGYLAELIYADIIERREKLFALKYCLVKEDPHEDPDFRNDYSSRTYSFRLFQEDGFYEKWLYPSFSRVDYISEDLQPKDICACFCDALRPAKKKAWEIMIHSGYEGELLWDNSYVRKAFCVNDSETPDWIDILLSMTLDFEGCGHAACLLHFEMKNTGRNIYERTVNLVRDVFHDRSWIWPKRLFWLVIAAEKGFTSARTVLFNEYLNLKDMDCLLPCLLDEISCGHSYAAVFAGLAAESGYICYEGWDTGICRADHGKSISAERDAFPEGFLDDVFYNKHPFGVNSFTDMDLAWFFYKQAASMGDPEGWYRLGRIAEYRERRPDEAVYYYRKAAEDSFLPALIKVAEYLERLPDDREEKEELRFLYDEIADIEEIRPVLMKMAQYKEKNGLTDEAMAAYEMAINCNGDPIKAEEGWAYCIWNDRMHRVIIPDEDEVSDEKDIYLGLGRLLMENPSMWNQSQWTPAECFREAAGELEDLADEWEKGANREKLSARVSVSTNEAYAMYYLGLCKLKGYERSNSMRQIANYFRIADCFGIAEARQYRQFFDEAEDYLTEVKRLSPDGEATAQMRQKEAEYRLQLLVMMGLPDRVREAYQETGFRCMTGDCGFYSSEEQKDELYEEIAEEISLMEHRHDASVYLVLATDGVPVNVSLFYVSSCIDEWPFERDQLASSEPYTYVFGARFGKEYVCTEIGPIGISVTDGYMERVW